MKKVILLLLTALLWSKTLEPVLYDPFKKAEKLVKKKKVKRKIIVKPVEIKLSGIYNNRAYINGKFYKVGDKLYGYRVYKIHKNYVILKAKVKRKTLYKFLYFTKNKILKMRDKK